MSSLGAQPKAQQLCDWPSSSSSFLVCARLPHRPAHPQPSLSPSRGPEPGLDRFWPSESPQKRWCVDRAKPHHAVLIFWGWTISSYLKTTGLGGYDPHWGKWGSPVLLIRTLTAWAQGSGQVPWRAAGVTPSQPYWQHVTRIRILFPPLNRV